MRLFLCALLSLSAPGAWAKQIVFSSADADPTEYRAHVLSSSKFVFPTEFFKADFPTRQSRQKLADAYQKARYSFLSGSLKDAATDFDDVLKLWPADQWKASEQSIFLSAYFALAQLRSGEKEADALLKEAVGLLPLASADPESVPPPILAKYNQLKRSMPQRKISFEKLSGAFRLVILNGRVSDVTENGSAEVSTARLHVTVLSDRFRTQSALLNANEVDGWRPARLPWVTGTCERASLAFHSPDVQTETFFGPSCSSKADGLIPTASFGPTEAKTDSLAGQLAMPTPTRPIYKKTWFWVGVAAAVITTAVVVSLANRPSHSNPQPITSEGL